MPEFIITKVNSPTDIHFMVEGAEHMSAREHQSFVRNEVEKYFEKNCQVDVCSFTGDYPIPFVKDVVLSQD